MRMRISRRVAALLAVACLAGTAQLAGCAARSALRGEPGVDLAPIRPGVSRAQVEAVVGTTDREWTTPAGVHYRVYRYDAGVPPSSFHAFHVLMGELATLGLVSAYVAATDPEALDKRPAEEHVFRDLAIAYDGADTVIGVFPDVDGATVLPVDGRPPAPPAPPASPRP
jgi:hypothetical protein